jgi:protein phosphatase PTC7
MSHSGHDWWFINQSTTEPARPTYLGVADGVGGWAEGGTDPAEVSQGIMFHADRILESSQSVQQREEGPTSLLSQAFQATLKDEQVRGGASTALIARLDPNTAALHWANLGDSSLIHIKAGAEKVGVQTKAQTHFFNCPYQLTKFPAGYSSQDFVADTPEMADSDSQRLEDGDLVLLFTDGIGDNLWTDEIRSLVRSIIKSRPSWKDPELVQALAHTICDCAQRASFQVGLPSINQSINHNPFPVQLISDEHEIGWLSLRRIGRRPSKPTLSNMGSLI